jgi:hypothetical protein
MRKADRKRPYPPDFVSTETLAYRLDCSERKVSDYARTGLLPRPINIGNLVRWFWPDVLDHIKSQNGLALASGSAEGNIDDDEYSQDIVKAKQRVQEATREKTHDRAA